MGTFPYRIPFTFPPIPNDKILKHLTHGNHLYCPEGLGFYKTWAGVIMKCCTFDAEERPRADQVYEELNLLMKKITDGTLEIEEKKDYSDTDEEDFSDSDIGSEDGEYLYLSDADDIELDDQYTDIEACYAELIPEGESKIDGDNPKLPDPESGVDVDESDKVIL
eukprot:TRINITY_DN1220_c0_g1_i1.p1 TRINITY_DN1220_c0_g1~~TRINITY_DN1220_c0_g1_i1.p1  ORF type:complete len:165 (-),score=35.63 TRINITY_DN1220_c0_g1_i1:247-741(-)